MLNLHRADCLLVVDNKKKKQINRKKRFTLQTRPTKWSWTTFACEPFHERTYFPRFPTASIRAPASWRRPRRPQSVQLGPRTHCSKAHPHPPSAAKGKATHRRSTFITAGRTKHLLPSPAVWPAATTTIRARQSANGPSPGFGTWTLSSTHLGGRAFASAPSRGTIDSRPAWWA